MTVLLSRSSRLEAGIDTIERSIVYALLSLRQVNADGANKESVQVTLLASANSSAGISASVSGQATLYYSSLTALGSGFNALEAIIPYTYATPELFQSFAPSLGLEEEIPEEPATVETLEQFLLWCALILSASTHPLSLNYVKFSFLESADPPNLSIAFTLPLDYGKFLLTGNWVESIQKVFDYHITDPDQLIGPFTRPPSQQFWGDPVNDLAALSALTGQAVGNTRWVRSEESFYSLLIELPLGETLDGVIYVAGEADTVWRKGGVKGDPGDPGTPGAVGPTGPAGNDGDSAYAIAVDNGFVGTEQEWLDSLIGETGPAGENGLPGTGVVWKGPWSSATSYIANDAVGYNGSSYIAVDANVNKVPGVASEWTLWVAKGEPGTGGSGHVIQNDGTSQTARANLNFKGFKITDDAPGAATIIQVVDTLTDKALYYYDATTNLLKPIAIGTDGQSLIAKPALNPPYQWATPSTGGGGGRELLTANRTYFIRTDGNDSNNGLANTSGGAFLTFAKARDVIRTLDGNGFNVTIKIADGTYNFGGAVQFSGFVGIVTIFVEGNTTTPANVVLQNGGGMPASTPLFLLSGPTPVDFTGFALSNTATNGFGIQGSNNSYAITRNIQYGAFGNCALLFLRSAVAQVGSFTISGSMVQFIALDSQSCGDFNYWNGCTLVGTPNFSARFLALTNCSLFQWIPSVVSFTGSATGVRYWVRQNSVLDQYGQGGNLPGNIDGTTGSGGQTI